MKLTARMFLVLLAFAGGSSPAGAAPLPEILLSPSNQVPGCVTPNRLMEFVAERNRGLNPPKQIDPRFSRIAADYSSVGNCVQRSGGKCVGVRWDYAFYQMLIETGYLNFGGGVKPEDNNFAGVGAPVPGQPGERFASVREGVRAHLQHVLMYSGTEVQNPIAKRTKASQPFVWNHFRQLGRPVTFQDLTSLWAGTKQWEYAASIERTADRFAGKYCGPK
jgi:Mannosyl-glycoprotein endo-beta-N-acetylglucosaminidase